MPIRHDNHVPSDRLIERTFAQSATFLCIRNCDSQHTIEISFDGNNTFMIFPGKKLSINAEGQTSYWTKAARGKPMLQVLIVSAT